MIWCVWCFSDEAGVPEGPFRTFQECQEAESLCATSLDRPMSEPERVRLRELYSFSRGMAGESS
jgi:hypothetical protein